jgi:4-nitrophenyl phosphatase
VILNLLEIRGVILDMDGVLWRDQTPFPDAAPFLDFLNRQAIPFQLATNNSTKTQAEYVAKCAALGLPVAADQIMTSGLVTLEYLRANFPAGTPIYVIGSDSLASIYTSAGYVLNGEAAQAVIVGLDIHVTYEKLKIAFRAIERGAQFIATNTDATFPAADGFNPGAGSLVAALERATGQHPNVMGKPEAPIFEVATKRLGCLPSETLMIGDRLDTDIAGAQRAGLRAALVLTGVSQRDEIGAITPDAVYETLGALHTAWQSSLA